uniref:Uncharacterized protein n=1 Tax=Trichobilharzia regenti TaxID=157069 RepID=A0AA85K502_TRIRE|nr:unnamed protein product [Trichobilharzia regenti]
MMGSSKEDSVNSNNGIKVPFQKSRRQFVWEIFFIVMFQISFVWEISAVVLLIPKLKQWMIESRWFPWLSGCLGTIIQLQILLRPQVQFVYPFNYIILTTSTIIISFVAALPLINMETWMMPVTWMITMVITVIAMTSSAFQRFDMLKSLRKLVFTTFLVQIFYCVIFFPFIHFQQIDILIILSGFGMVSTIIWEMACVVQAVLGDRSFTFQDNQYILCASIITMLIIWLQLIVSTAAAIILVLINSMDNVKSVAPSVTSIHTHL